jgi:spore coat protein U-like protein
MKTGYLNMNRRTMAVALASALALTATLVAVDGHATDATANLGVSATVTTNCSISTSPVAFGDYNAISGNDVDANGSVTVQCTNGTAATVKLGQGTHADTGSTDASPLRRLRRAATADYLSYQLYSDSPAGTTWGNTTGTGVAHSGDGTATQLTVYGRLFGTQAIAVSAGAFADTVVATITF